MEEVSWKAGDDPDARDGPGRTVLHRLCQRKQLSSSHVSLLTSVLSAGGNPDLRDTFGRTALSLTCMESGSEDAVRALVAHSADIHSRDEWGR